MPLFDFTLPSMKRLSPQNVKRLPVVLENLNSYCPVLSKYSIVWCIYPYIRPVGKLPILRNIPNHKRAFMVWYACFLLHLHKNNK